MKTVVGFALTQTPMNRLRNQGFYLHENESTLEHGYREFIIPFSPTAGTGHSIEFRELVDEDLYFKFQQKRDLSPFESENKHIVGDFIHPNQVYCMAGIFGADMPECELKEYLKIRKPHSIWVLWLKCKKWNDFEIAASPDLFFRWQNGEAALIHLGQSCFDLLITAD